MRPELLQPPCSSPLWWRFLTERLTTRLCNYFCGSTQASCGGITDQDCTVWSTPPSHPPPGEECSVRGGLHLFTLLSFDISSAGMKQNHWKEVHGWVGGEGRGGWRGCFPKLPSKHHMGSSLVLAGARGSSQNSHDNEAQGH